MKYCVFSGWYCDDKPRNYATFGTHKIREKDFFNLWYKSITTFTKPEKIFITDSASPVKPDLPDDPRIEFVSLYKNFGHAQHKDVVYCGSSKSVLSGIFYAQLNEFDYAVHVEQDILLYGEGIVEKLINTFPKNAMIVPQGKGTFQPAQQSFMIIHKSAYMKFINLYLEFSRGDGILSPEAKVYLIAQHIGGALVNLGYGRARPIDFSQEVFFIEHATEEELTAYLDKTGFEGK